MAANVKFLLLAASNRIEVLRLYRSFLREAKNFSSYNFRSYAIRKVRDTFRQHKDETNPDTIQSFLNGAEKELDSLKRQTFVNKMYGTSKLVIEKD